MNESFRRLFPITANAELATLFSVSEGTIERWAQRAGLRKDADYRRGVQRRNATGRVVTAEGRERMRARAIGRRVSPETVSKILESKRARGTLPRGERHYAWKGGRPWERFSDERYLIWRTAVLERDNYVCQDCGRVCAKYERGLAAHHLLSYAEHPDMRYEISNGVTLCRDCHMDRHGRRPRPPELIACACGCGTMISPRDRYGRPRRYVNHHSQRGRPKSKEHKEALRRARVGGTLSLEHRARIAAGLRTTQKRIGRPPKRV
jgi:5-methylcytosine-specific restriction endonuclease McrA